MPWYAIAIWLLSFIVGVYFVVKSWMNVSPLGEENFWKVFFLYPILSREYFTEKGWRYNQRARVILFYGFLIAIILRFTTGN